MKTFSAKTLAAAVALLLVAVGAQADEGSGKTRAQMRAELAEAERTGDAIAAGEAGRTLDELHPQRYVGARTPSQLAVRRGSKAPWST